MPSYDVKPSIYKISERIKKSRGPVVVFFSGTPDRNFGAHLGTLQKMIDMHEYEPEKIVGTFDKSFDENDLYEDCRYIHDNFYPDKPFHYDHPGIHNFKELQQLVSIWSATPG